MSEFSRVPSRVAAGGSIGSDVDRNAAGPLWAGRLGACAALVLASALIVSASVPAIAVAQELNRIWADCELSTAAVDALEASMDPPGSGIGTPEIAFVVVYSLNHDNDGQPLQNGSGSTGAVICTNTEVVADPEETSQTTDIGSGNVTILDAEEAFIVRYQIGSTIEKRVCHTVNQNTDCYSISP